MDKRRFKELESYWYGKLAEEGFRDIEKDGQLRVYADRRLRNFSVDETFHPDKNSAKEAYYQLAGEFLHTHRFESEMERLIWEMHGSGMSINQIKTELLHRGLGKGRRQICGLIQRLRNQMLHMESS